MLIKGEGKGEISSYCCKNYKDCIIPKSTDLYVLHLNAFNFYKVLLC